MTTQARPTASQPSQAAQSLSQKGEGEGRTDRQTRQARHTRRDDQRFNVVFCVLAIATDIVQERKVSIVVDVRVVVMMMMMARVEARLR